MLYLGDFEDPQAAVGSVVVHAIALGVALVSITVNGSQLVVETLGTFPEEQLEHLGLAGV